MEKFADIIYQRPDASAVKKEMDEQFARFKKAKTADEAIEAFLEWNRITETVSTMYSIAYIRNTANMKDEFYDGEIQFFNTEMPKFMLVMKKGAKVLLKSPFRAEIEEKYGSHFLKDTETQEKLMKPSVILPSVKENKLATEYSKTAAACSTEFMGEKCNLYGLLRHMQSVDREERRNAFLAWAKLYEDASPALEKQYAGLVKTRRTIAKKLGFKSYIDYIYLSRGRYDYNSGDIAAFRESVRKYITPVCERMYREQAQSLGIDKLHWYDESLVFPEGNPIPQGTPEELTRKAREMYRQLSPETGEFFDFMSVHELFDFVTRENKHLGGYCTSLPSYKAPFIFSNFNGTSADVDVLTHEAGHAFEYYYASRRLPFDGLVHSTSEINEIHSMTMELLTYPYMESFFGENADKYRFAHFTDSFREIPYLVAVDEFQHRVFEDSGSTAADWRRIWRETERKYLPWRDYEGSDFLQSGGFWMQKQHIFLYPFYYVDYALAQLGAFSIFRCQTETGDAWERYLSLCSLGGKYGYFETLEKAGIPLPLLEENVRGIAEFVDGYADKLKKKAL